MNVLVTSYHKFGSLKLYHTLSNNSVDQKPRQAQLCLRLACHKAEIKVFVGLGSYTESLGKSTFPRSFKWLGEFISMLEVPVFLVTSMGYSQLLEAVHIFCHICPPPNPQLTRLIFRKATVY